MAFYTTKSSSRRGAAVTMSEKNRIIGMLEQSGVTVNGPEPWDPQIVNEALWDRVYAHGSLGLGEAYMDRWWECADLAEFFTRVIGADLGFKIRVTPNVVWQNLQARYRNMQTIRKSKRVARMHYNETDAYAATLDKRMTGSCAYWKDVDNLDDAQEAKLDLVCRKLGLLTGDRLLDIGSGWGALMGFAAEKYGVEAVGVTVSPDQAAYATERYKGLPVEFLVKDYREFDGKVDHIASMGMFEHVGYKNHRAYFELARKSLKDGGLFLLHTIGLPYSSTSIDTFLEKYIFPGGVIPSIAQIGTAIDGLFDVVDLHNIGPHYDPTLIAWCENFHAKWPRPNTEEEYRFYRMWEYYLLCCAGGFRSRALQVWQLVLSPKGVPEGYQFVR